MAWNWYVSQIFALIGLVFVIISNQQKTAGKLLIFRQVTSISVAISVCFLGEVSAIIMASVGIARNAVGMYFIYKPQAKKRYKVIACSIIIAVLVGLNIYFWRNFYNLFSILAGTALIIAFVQENAKRIRIITVFAELLATTYYLLLLAPMNALIEGFAMISAFIGILRLDIKRKANKTNLDENT